ncbi:hypothetical protein ANCCAN_05259, partial [Ancylostoma caninum]
VSNVPPPPPLPAVRHCCLEIHNSIKFTFSQHFTKNPFQCQCIPPPGGAQPCLPYDSRFQAATLEEAMTSFPDLSLDQQEPGQVTTLASQVTCQTQECLDCQKDLRHKLEQVRTSSQVSASAKLL